MVIDMTIHVRRAAAGDAVRIDALVRSLSVHSIAGRFMGGVSGDFAIEELCREVRGNRAEFAPRARLGRITATAGRSQGIHTGRAGLVD
jgi:hypothetical protein